MKFMKSCPIFCQITVVTIHWLDGILKRERKRRQGEGEKGGKKQGGLLKIQKRKEICI